MSYHFIYSASSINRFTKIVLFVMLLQGAIFMSKNAWAEEIIDGRYQVQAGGSEIKDLKTNLVWARCSVGQNWSNNKCQGKPKKFEFEQISKSLTKGWRLPTVRELHGLVLCSTGKTKFTENPDKQGDLEHWCDGDYKTPTINSKAFPDTFLGKYWSSTADSSSDPLGWTVNFEYGYIEADFREYPVRLVRVNR